MDENRYAAAALQRLTLAHWRDFLRQPTAMIAALALPALLAAVLGVAVREGPLEIEAVAVTTPALLASLETEPLLAPRLMPAQEAELALRAGRVALVVEAGDDGALTYLYDPDKAAARAARFLADRAVQRDAGQTDPVATKDIARSTPGSRYIDFLLPGLLGATLMGGALWGVGYGLIDARRRGPMRLMLATPLPRGLYLLSFAINALMVNALATAVLLAFGGLVFHAPVRGALPALALLCLVASLSFSGLGLLLGSRVGTMRAAAGWIGAAMTLMPICAGVFFPTHNFPAPLRPLMDALPLSAAVDALRALMLRGATLSHCAGDLAWLLVWGFASLALALWLFRWR